MKRTYILIIIIILSLVRDYYAQELNDDFTVTAPVIIGKKMTIQSKILKEDREILISLPRDYNQSNEKYPVLYITDGESYFTLARGIVNLLVSLNWMPDVIIVAIENTDRMRDLTPTNISVYVVSEEIKKEWPTSGGADQFIQFYKRELIQAVESNYRTMPCRIFAGHSLGGLFGFYCISTSPGLFDATIAIGPALWWDHRIVTTKLKKFFEKTTNLNHILFFSLATEDIDEDDPVPSVQMRTVLKRNIPKGFRWEFSDLSDETHDSAVLRGLYYGLRYVFERWRLTIDSDADRFKGTLEELIEHYNKVFNGVGFKPPEGQVDEIAHQRLNRKLYDEAIEFLRYNIEQYPESPNTYNSLGEALEKSGRLKEALSNFRKAVEIGKRYNDDNINRFIINRDRVSNTLKNDDLHK